MSSEALINPVHGHQFTTKLIRAKRLKHNLVSAYSNSHRVVLLFSDHGLIVREMGSCENVVITTAILLIISTSPLSVACVLPTPPCYRALRGIYHIPAAVHCAEWAGFSSARPSRTAQGPREPKPRKRPHGLVTGQGCRSSGRAPTDAAFPATATATAGSQRCSADPPPSPQCREEAGPALQTTAMHGDSHPWPSPDRSSASFLVLTLGFLRRLVEIPLAAKGEKWTGNSNATIMGSTVDTTRDERLRDWADWGDRVGRGSGQNEQSSPVAEPPWRDLADALNKVSVLDAEQGLHSRLIDDISPTLLVEGLVPLVVGMFRPPPDVFRRCKLHHGSGGSDDSSGITCCCGSSDVSIFLGSAVRDPLASNHDRETNATSIDDDRQRHVVVSSVSNVSDVSGVADTARDGHIRIPTPDTAPVTDTQRRDGHARGTEVSSLPSQLGFDSSGGKDVAGDASESSELLSAGSISSSSLSSGGDSTTTFLDEDASVLSSITSHSAHTTHLHPPTSSGGQAHRSGGSADTNGDVRRKSLLELSAGRDFSAGQEATAAAAEVVSVNNHVSQSAVRRFSSSGGLDLAVLAEMLRANAHIEYFGLARDARMFAIALNRLAGDNSSSDSDKMRQLPARTASNISRLNSSS